MISQLEEANGYPPEDVPYELAKAWKSMKECEKFFFIRRIAQRNYNERGSEEMGKNAGGVPLLNLPPPVHQTQCDGGKLDTNHQQLSGICTMEFPGQTVLVSSPLIR